MMRLCFLTLDIYINPEHLSPTHTPHPILGISLKRPWGKTPFRKNVLHQTSIVCREIHFCLCIVKTIPNITNFDEHHTRRNPMPPNISRPTPLRRRRIPMQTPTPTNPNRGTPTRTNIIVSIHIFEYHLNILSILVPGLACNH